MRGIKRKFCCKNLKCIEASINSEHEKQVERYIWQEAFSVVHDICDLALKKCDGVT